MKTVQCIFVSLSLLLYVINCDLTATVSKIQNFHLCLCFGWWRCEHNVYVCVGKMERTLRRSNARPKLIVSA